MTEPLFPNRIEAGKILAKKLHHYADRNEVLILAIPRGGVPVAFAVSQALNVPLDIVLVRKLGLPGREEFAMGAIASDGIELLNKDLIDTLRITPSAVDKIRAEQLQELKRCEAAYRGDLNWPRHKAECFILIDDGLATGYSMRVAIEATKHLDAKKIVVAVPVAAKDTVRDIANFVDEIICVSTPEPFIAVGKWYKDFNQVCDEEVHRLLKKSWKH